jgi:uncharacterized membrane protein
MLSRESLWLDEVASWRFAGRDIGGVLQSETTNPPFYYLLLHFWMGSFGSSESALRSLSIVPSVFTVWLVYIFSQRLFNRQIAFLAAIYQSISTFQIYYAQEARCFSLLVSILMLAALCLWNALGADSRKTRFAWYAGYAALGALSLYTHFIAIFFLAGLGLYVLLRRPRQLLNATISSAASLIVFSPWLVTMLRTAAGGGQSGRRYFLLKLPQAYFSFLYGGSLIPLDDEAVRHVSQTLKSHWWILAVSLMSLMILAPFWRRAWNRWGESMSFVFMMAVVPVLLAFFISFKVMLFSERYLVPASPAIYVMFAATIWEVWVFTASKDLPSWKAKAGWAACLAYCCLLALSLHNYYFNPRFGKEQWREADAYIDSLTPTAGNGIIVFDPDYLRGCYSYYTKRNLPSVQVTPEMELALRTSGDPLEEHTRGFQRILLVRSHDDEDTVLNVMTKAYHLESYRKFEKANPIEVYSFSPAP